MRPQAQQKVWPQRDKPRDQPGLLENDRQDCVENPVVFVELYLLGQIV